MKHVLFICLLCMISQLSAQEVVSAGGDHFATSEYSVSFTIGELAIETVSSDNRTLTQGFHQANLTVTSVSEASGIDVNVFPNPATNRLNISGLESAGPLQILLIDVTGRTLLNYQLSMQSSIDVSQLPVGVYVLSISSMDDLSINYSATIQKR